MDKVTVIPETEVVNIVTLKDVLILVQFHAEGKEEEFINKALELVGDNEQLFYYILAQYGRTNTFSADN